MYNSESTSHPEPDPLGAEVFVDLTERLSSLPVDFAAKIDVAIAASGDLPSPELVRLLAQAGIYICQSFQGAAAEKHVVKMLCYFAIRRDRLVPAGPRWFEGVLLRPIDLIDDPDPEVASSLGGHRGRLTVHIRRQLHVAPDFAPYWFARQGVPTDSPRPKITRHAPPPPTELSGTGGWHSPALPLGAPELNQYVTVHFPEELRSAAEEAEIAASRQFRAEVQKAKGEGRINKQTLAGLRLAWFWKFFLGFAEAARDMVLAGTLKERDFRWSWRDLFREAAIAADIKVDAELKDSPEWEELEKIRLDAIRGQPNLTTPKPPVPSGPERPSKVDGKKLKTLRGSTSQEALAEVSKVSLITIRRGEAGERWSDRTFDDVAKGLSVILKRKITPEELKANPQPPQ